ncbi:MAG: TAXI family TRAP transporter solute-binding subunit [Candidatus Limivicinus sp.]|nr:TAXI family TRAP transporter solute-binding subunit [Candidatus Limivicinus sp.]
MKKTLAVILCVCMMLALFAGCGESASTQQPAAAQTEAPAEPADENALPEQYDLIMTFGAETGSVYAMGIQIGEYINSIAPDITCTVKVGAAASNLALLSTGETVIAHSQSDTIHEAIVGEGNFTEPVTGIYGVASVMESVLHVAVPADAPINSFKDIVDQKYPIKVSVGAQGSGIESLFRKVLAYYGASYDDIAAWGGKVEYLNIGDASTLFTDGQLNAVSVLAGMPYSTISEIAASKDIKLLTLEQEAVDALSSQGYLAKTIPAGTYTGQDSDVSTVGVAITVCASADANEAVVYEITKFLNSEEGISILGNVNSGFANYMTGPESGIAGIELELHPGAARYYKEAGVA